MKQFPLIIAILSHALYTADPSEEAYQRRLLAVMLFIFSAGMAIVGDIAHG